MSRTGKLVFALLFTLLAAQRDAFAQRRVITNEDLPAAVPAEPAAPADLPAQPAGQAPTSAASAGAAGQAAQPADENAAKRADAEKAIQRMEEIRIGIREALDIFFDKIREGAASEPTINKWNQVRDNLVLASDELGLFINEARRNLPPPAAPANPAASPAN